MNDMTRRQVLTGGVLGTAALGMAVRHGTLAAQSPEAETPARGLPDGGNLSGAGRRTSA